MSAGSQVDSVFTAPWAHAQRAHKSGGRGGAEEGKGGQTHGGEGRLDYGGPHAMQHADGVSRNCAPETRD